MFYLIIKRNQDDNQDLGGLIDTDEDEGFDDDRVVDDSEIEDNEEGHL